ncbi:MAG: DUF4097 family beta strand repeat protein [Melioribacteraceae bacterium]|nr:DUF4097 family beta strand repeat protein [Melioribacteraceae bacterium]
MRSLKYVFILILSMIVMTGSIFAGTEKNIKKSFDVSYGGKLSLDSDLGSIKVNTSNSEVVEVEIKLYAKANDEDDAEEIFEDFDINFNHSGDNVKIDADYRKSKSWFGNWNNKLKVKFIITVPSNYNLDLSTSGGSISVSDIKGKVDAKTSGGSLEFAHVMGELNGKTSGGSISLDKCDGDVDVHTSGGSITIGEVKGRVFAKTSGGKISVEEVMGQIKASTSGGSISAAISKQPEADCELKTSGGSINVKLSNNINAYLDARTSGGSVDCDFPVTVRGKMKSNRLEGKINDGGPQLYFRTSGGSIIIREIN